ncbi:formyl transferase [Candidatus Omnitrophota bacterium]
MLKIFCMIRHEAPLVYFVNKINERHKISLAVVESPSVKKRIISKIRSKGILGVISGINNRLLEKVGGHKKINDWNYRFGNKWRSIDSGIPILKVDDINAQVVDERLKEEQPDLILDHGTSIVKDRIIKTAKLALNLHWGLSPYYRGSSCTEWALINRDPFNIGVTIHKLIKNIDGGDILAQKRAVIKPGDTVHSINMQLTQMGTELVIRAIDKIRSNEQLRFETQNFSSGFLTLNRQWSGHLRRQIEYIEKNNLIASMLRHPARKKRLPTVEL